MRHSAITTSMARATMAAAFALLLACAMPIHGCAQTGSQATETPGADSKAGPPTADHDDRAANHSDLPSGSSSIQPNRPAELEAPSPIPLLGRREDTFRTVQTVALFGLISLLPISLDGDGFRADQHCSDAAAAGSGQPAGARQPGIHRRPSPTRLTRPHAERVYQDGIRPYASGELSAAQAWTAGSKPIKAFMVDQIIATKHEEIVAL